MHVESFGEQPKIIKSYEIQHHLIEEYIKKFSKEQKQEREIEWVSKNAANFRELITNPDLGLYEMYVKDPKIAESFIEHKLEELRNARKGNETVH